MSWFDIIVVVIVVGSLIKGYTSGLMMQIASLTGLILGAIFAGKLSALIAPWLIKLTDGSPHIIGPLSYIIAFILIIVALLFIGKLATSLVKAIHMSGLNRLAGAIFCCCKWVILFSILLNLVVEFDQSKGIIKEGVREQSHTYPLVMEVAQKIIPYLRFDWIT